MDKVYKQILENIRENGRTFEEEVKSAGFSESQIQRLLDHHAKQTASTDSLSFVKPTETQSESTATRPLTAEDVKAKTAKEAEFHKTPIGQRDWKQWNGNISPVTNIVAHPLAAFSAGMDKLVQYHRPDLPQRTFSENYDLAMERYLKQNEGNPRSTYDDLALGGSEMLAETIVTGALPLGLIAKAAQKGKKLSTLGAYAFPSLQHTAKPLRDAAVAAKELPVPISNPYIRTAGENLAFGAIDPEMSWGDVVASVGTGIGAQKALGKLPFLTNAQTRQNLIDDGDVGVRAIIDAPKQGAHAERYTEALPWVIENLETRHWKGGGPRKTLRNLEKGANEAMEKALQMEPGKHKAVGKAVNEKADEAADILDLHKKYSNYNPKKLEKLSTQGTEARNILERNPSQAEKEVALQKMNEVFEEGVKMSRSKTSEVAAQGRALMTAAQAELERSFGAEAAKQYSDALFKKAVADSYGVRINLGELNASKKDIHQAAKDAVFTQYIDAANLSLAPGTISRHAYKLTKDNIFAPFLEQQSR